MMRQTQAYSIETMTTSCMFLCRYVRKLFTDIRKGSSVQIREEMYSVDYLDYCEEGKVLIY